MVDNLIGEVIPEAVVALQRIAVKVRSYFDVDTYQRLQGLLTRLITTFARTLPPRSRTFATMALPSGPRPWLVSGALICVHVTSSATNEGFVRFDFAAQLTPVDLPCMASRARCNINQAVFWVTPIVQRISHEPIPFLQFTNIHITSNHF